MALQKAPLAVTFGGGVDTKTDAKQVAPTKLITLQNCVFTRSMTLKKRNGYSALGTGIDGTSYTYLKSFLRNSPTLAPGFLAPPALSTGIPGGSTGIEKNGFVAGLGKRGDELILFANNRSYSYRSSTDSWSDIGSTSSVVAQHDPVARTGTAQTSADLADNAGITAVAWEDSRGGVWCSVLETASGRVLLDPVQLDASGTSPRCCAVGSVLHVYYVVGNRLWVAVITADAPQATPVPVILTEDLAGGAYDAMATFSSAFAIKPALIAWRTATGYRVGYVHPSGVLGSPVTGLPTVGTFTATITGPIAVALAQGTWTTGFAAVLWASSDLNYRIHVAQNPANGSQPTGVLSAGPVTWNRIACAFGDPDPSGSSVLWWAGEVNGSSADKNIVRSGQLSSTGGILANADLRGHVIASRAFYDTGEVFCCVTHPVLYFPYVACVQLSNMPYTAARFLPGVTSGVPTRSVLPSVIPVDPNDMSTSRQHAVALGYRIQLSGTSGTQFGEAGILRTSIDFDHDDAFRSAELGRGLYLSGALIQQYDGLRWAEADFHCAPDTASGTIGTVLAAGGSLTTSATYVYKLLYEEIDAQGELHPGAVSVGVSITTGSNTKCTLTIPTYRLTGKHKVRIGVFRSLANDASKWFRVSSVDPTAVGNNGYVLNDPAVDSVSFVDVMADTAAAVLEPLYTNGGVLGNDPSPQGGEIIAGGKSRLFWTDPLDGALVRYSQQLRDDTALEASAFLSQRVDPFGGDIVALATMDDNVIVFKETAIYAFGGPGPDADGGQTTSSGFTAPQLVTSDVGCKSRSSVCQMPLGVVFQSDKGIYLLGRDLSVRRIGDDVYGFNAQTITRSTLLPDRPQVVFLTSSGSTLLFDYDRDQWSTFSNHEGLDAIVVGGSYYYLRNDGRVFVETPDVYVDGTSMHIPMLIETAWIRFSNYLQGWQKVLHAEFLGEYESQHTLRVRYRLDYQDGYSAPIDIDVDSNYNPGNYGDGSYGSGAYGGVGGDSTVYQESIHLNRRCQAISFRIEDVEQAANFGAAFQLSELLLIGGMLGPKFPVGAARSQ